MTCIAAASEDPYQNDVDKPPKPPDKLSYEIVYLEDVKAAEADFYQASDGLHLDSDHGPAVKQLAAGAVHLEAASDGEHGQIPAKTSPLAGTGSPDHPIS